MAKQKILLTYMVILVVHPQPRMFQIHASFCSLDDHSDAS